MARLLIHVEGQTEESFVKEVLREHLQTRGYGLVAPRIIGNSRLRHRRGGICSWPSARKDIVNHLKEDRTCIATTMVDYYGLPQKGEGGWPGRAKAATLAFPEKAKHVQDAIVADIASDIDRPSRFIPFVLMHEFEGLLFSDCRAFSEGIGQPERQAEFEQIRRQFKTPEEINDSPQRAPSKRIAAIIPGYEKPLLGILAVLQIGLGRIRQECPHFDQWLKHLESVAQQTG